MKQFHNVGPLFSPGKGCGQGTVHRPGAPVYRVGELFRKGRREWPEGTQFGVGQAGCELTLFRGSVDDDLVRGVRADRFEFALLAEGPVIVFSYAQGAAIPWEEALYCWHLQPRDTREIPRLDPSPEARTLLWITLVGACDGVIHAQRGIALPPLFSRALNGAIRRQAMMSFRPIECTAAIARIFLDFPDPAERLAMAAIRAVGNE